MTVDSIHPSPNEVDFLERCDDTSNAPLPAVYKLVSKDPSTAIGAKPMKCDGSDLCLPNTKKICLAPSAVVKPHLTSLHPCCIFRNPQCFANSTDFVGW